MGDKEDFKRDRKAAEQGDATAQCNLGWMYEYGRGVDQDDREAAYWYCKSAEQGDATAQFNLGWMYEYGRGVDQDDSEAVCWYSKSAEQGVAGAQRNLGLLYQYGRGVDQDDREAVRWYSKSAEQGDANAQLNLGNMYAEGRGVDQDNWEAVYWYSKSAEQGVAGAQRNLGLMYQYGLGVDQDGREAVYWYRKSAEQGNADAQCHLGMMYFTGQGVNQDDREAVRWYRQSAEQGDATAQFYLGWMYEYGRGVDQDDREAVYWYRKSAEQGDARAQFNLGWMYEYGRGVDQDDREAVYWYRKAAEQRYELAIQKLEQRELSANATPSEEAKPAPADLTDLIGITRVKEQVESLTNFIRVQKSRRDLGLKTPPLSLHLVFTGNPGTGKTTVARRIGNIYKDLGLLQKGHVVECQRQDLVGEYIGKTAPKVKQKCDDAMDGVLFIDEAYSLAPPHSENDFGVEAISALIAEMENRRDRLVVIVAGYTREMEVFMNANPGLRSRFSRTLHFEDYTAGELVEIFERFAVDADYVVDEQAKTVLHGKFEKALADKPHDFGNGRHARNLFEQVVEKHAARVARLVNPDRIALQTITALDLP